MKKIYHDKRLYALNLAFLLALGVFAFFQYIYLNGTCMAEQYFRVAISTADKCNLAISDAESAVEALARNGSGALPDIGSCEDMLAMNIVLGGVHISDGEGNIVATTAECSVPGGLNKINDQEYFRKAVHGRSSVTGPFAEPGQGAPCLLVSSPCYDGTGRFIGVVGASIRLEELMRVLTPAPDVRYPFNLVLCQSGGKLTEVYGPLSKTERELFSAWTMKPKTGAITEMVSLRSVSVLVPLQTSGLWVGVSAPPRVLWKRILNGLMFGICFAAIIIIMLAGLLLFDRQKRLRDIETQERLAFLGQMSATLAHEIRNPLTFIKGALQMKKPITDTDLQLMLEEVEQIEGILSEVLLAARPISTQPTRVDMHDVMTEAARMVYALAADRGISVECLMTGTDVPVWGDRLQLRHLLVNLLKNGIEATGPGGIVSISAAVAGEQVVIRVRDQGQGMSPDQVKELGRLFFTTKQEGTGLGLPLCYRIVKEHSGRITVTSRRGEGTEFTVWLPLDKSLG